MVEFVLYRVLDLMDTRIGMNLRKTVTISDLDIYRSARLLTDRHGDEAPIHAAMKADAMLETGDMDGRAVWLRILKAVEELLRGRGDDPLH